MNYLRNNISSSGYILFGYANTTDPEPVNNLFEKYTSYTIKIKEFYNKKINPNFLRIYFEFLY